MFLCLFCTIPTATTWASTADSNVEKPALQDQSAQIHETKHVLWLFPSSTLSAADDARFLAGLREALAQDLPRHLLNQEALQAHVAMLSVGVPACAIGQEVCVSPQALIFETLGLSLVIRLRLQTHGTIYKANYELLDRRGQAFRAEQLTATSPRELAFTVVRTIFDATGNVSFDSSPRGAAVVVSDQTLGKTPFSHNFPVGIHPYKLQLDAHRVVEGVVEVTSAGSKLIRHDLDVLPGLLILEKTPEGALLYVNGDMVGDAHEAFPLSPGSYAIEVRAQGYESYRQMIRIAAGREVRRQIYMEPHHPLLKKIPLESIYSKRYGGRFLLEQGFHATTFRNARARVEGQEYEFRNFTDPDTGLENSELRRFVAPTGLRLEAHYNLERFGLTLLSLSYLEASLQLPAVMEHRQSGNRLAATVSRVQRLQIRPFQLSYRYIYENIAPMVELGTGINFQWAEVQSDLHPSLSLSQTEAFWTFGLGAHYYFNANVSIALRYHLQSYFNSGLGAEHLVNLGIGIALQNVLGFEPEPPGQL